MAMVMRQEKIPVLKHDAVSDAIATLLAALKDGEKIAKDARVQELIISHPGNSDSMILYRTSSDT